MSDWSSDVCSSDLDSPPLLGIEIGVFAAYRDAQERQDVVYLQSSRQIVDGAELIASFEEGHSHATTHLIQVADLAIEDMVRAATRSEEHTSELQSLMRTSYAVFCLKTKKKKQTHNTETTSQWRQALRYHKPNQQQK